MKKQFIQDFFKANDGIIRTKQLRKAGFTHFQLNQLIQTGEVLKVKQGIYKWNDSNQSELAEVAHIVPEGIFCLYTACQYYELSTFVASSYHLAIPKKSKVVLPDYPPIKLYYWETDSYQTGQTEIKQDGVSIRMYDLEKTVCDIIRQRNKVGLDIVKEVVVTYLQRTDRNLAKLVEYAGELGLKNYVSNYLNILV
ncbi:type IV toxin-antitoxin system AbiEi family antitoxin domain-containing protein [Spirosoma agri]|uniref:Type IV toxin-antitoxin system AbiEi family antitoxin domain-containing protein n=1 Tax=Spirosoma agri TaxID=1987381 RepID=A0A6M0IQL6_9BACT|nr:type IV toxin-antitoxin system AbiEi family antitoxin domain-containing protein [Spirosoma agri]NEU70578.1 type IV toxin-antitoxin system AbiEi family antitoxin domain-containing protein [Spirosoma agri]